MKHAKAVPAQASLSGALSGVVKVPGDKSISHRALILSSQAIGMSSITGLLEGEDVLRTATALQQMGVKITRISADEWQVHGVGIGGLHEPEDILDMGNSGTSTRLLMGLLASYPFVSIFTGDASLRKRPMRRVLEPLQQIGASNLSRSAERLPLALQGASLPIPLHYKLPVASAQVKSALLLAGLNMPGKTIVEEPTPTRDHTERMLLAMGADIEIKNAENSLRRISIKGFPNLKPMHWQVPGDPSSAAFIIAAAAAIPGSSVTVENVNVNPLRMGFYATLAEMGAEIILHNEKIICGEEVADISIKGGVLKAVHCKAERAASMIDEYPILAVLAANAEGVSHFEGLAELKVKESNRLQAIFDGLQANSVAVEMGEDWLKIVGMPGKIPGGGKVVTHLDHRIAMSFLILGLFSKVAVSVDDTQMIDTSFPGFIKLLTYLGANIALDNCGE